MSNFNYKFVKPLTSLVLGATLLTSAIIAPVNNAEAAGSSSYKITKGKLVSKSTGKIVKGIKTYKRKVYKDGKLLTGLKSGFYYKKGIKSTGWYKGKWYEKGKALTGYGKNTSKLYINGQLAMGNWYKGKWYENGKALTGLGKNTGKLYINGVLNTGKYLFKNKLYNGAVLNKGLTLYSDKLYNGAALNVGIIQYGGKWYSGSSLASGKITTPDGKTIQVENGIEISSGNNGGGDSEENFTLSLMHTNDTHAHLDNIAKRTTAIKDVRAKKPNSLLLDAGDVFSGTLYFNEFQGKADLEFMNLLRYDAMTFGNHEFDLGSSKEGHKALADFIEGANFPFVSANVNFSADDRFKGLFSDLISSNPEKGKIYNGIIKEINGEKVGIFGLTTEETKGISSPGSIVFENYIKEAEKAVKAFEGQGVDKIIALTHIGYDDNAAIDNDLTLATAVEGIDIIVGGHSHTQLDKPVIINKDNKEKDPTIIVQAYQYSDFLGTLDVEFDGRGKVTKANGELIDLSKLKEDPEAANILKTYSEQIKDVSSKPIGATAISELINPRITDQGNDGTSVRNSETALGNIITDGMLAKAKTFDEKVIMALQNGGGIRSGINAGEITVGEVITVLPFGNTLATMTLTGAELKQAFETSFKESPKENGGFLHVSGAKVEYDSSKPKDQRVVSIKYQDAKGKYIDIKDNENYTVATNAFTAKGGDGYDVFKKAYGEGRVTDLGLSDWENLAEHLTSLKEIEPKIEGRIVDVSKEENPNTELPGGNVAGADFSGTISKPKVYKESVTVDITDISSLSNAVIKGDLIITGKLSGNISISNIKVEGNLDLSAVEGDITNKLENIDVTGETIF